MDRNEAVQKLATAGRLSIAHAEDLYDSLVLKPVVPQNVADWYEEIKDSFEYNLIEAINNIPYGAPEEEFSDFEKWLEDEQSLTTLVNMHQFGYTVEKEKRYQVKIKATRQYLSNEDNWPHFNLNFKTPFTKSELERLGFDWVLDCEGIEVEEVE